MVKIIKWIKFHLPTQRRLIQLYAALLYNAHVKGYIKGNIYTGNSKAICVPGLNCYSCPGAIGACPLGALQNALASSGQRTPSYVLGILLLYGLTFGRTICGFLCPFGLFQELLHKLPTPKIHKNQGTRALSYLKYLILLVFVVIIPLWFSLQQYPVPAFCKYICPAGTIEGAIGLLAHPINADKYSMLGWLFTHQFIILLFIVGICVFCYRAFCRFLCPLGAIYGLFSKIALIGVKIDHQRCVHCDKCITLCKMDISRVGDHECIHCGECIDVCPTSAISFRAGKYTITGASRGIADASAKPANKHKHIIAWTVAIVLLATAFVYFNSNTSHSEDPVNTVQDIYIDNPMDAPQAETLPVGKDVGMLAPDFRLPVLSTDDEFVLSNYRGKKVVINFWATWCGPCVKELPYFDQAHRMYGDDVVVIAIHSNLVTDDIQEYLSGYDYQMAFALDQDGVVITAFGGSTMLPHTVIIDETGVIIYNAVGSMTFEQLATLLITSPNGLDHTQPASMTDAIKRH